jgi:hypothetical protein
LSGISTATLQQYVDKRTTEKGRDGKSISYQTIKKEIGTHETTPVRGGAT